MKSELLFSFFDMFFVSKVHFFKLLFVYFDVMKSKQHAHNVSSYLTASMVN